MIQAGIQTAVSVLFPPRCITCGQLVEDDFALCGPCWRQTPIISGAVCSKCGAPVPEGPDQEALTCDDCLTTARPWQNGSAALIYSDFGRKLVLSLKHGDNHEVARLAAPWMMRRLNKIAGPDAILVPIPLHWTRMMRRRFNQSALLAQQIGRLSGHRAQLDLLLRGRRTRSLDGLTRTERFEELRGGIRINPRRADLIAGATIILIDDVMTSGATFAAATEACMQAGACSVGVLALARVAKDA